MTSSHASAHISLPLTLSHPLILCHPPLSRSLSLSLTATLSLFMDLTLGRGQYIQVYFGHSRHGTERPLLYSVEVGPALVHRTITRIVLPMSDPNLNHHIVTLSHYLIHHAFSISLSFTLSYLTISLCLIHHSRQLTQSVTLSHTFSLSYLHTITHLSYLPTTTHPHLQRRRRIISWRAGIQLSRLVLLPAAGSHVQWPITFSFSFHLSISLHLSPSLPISLHLSPSPFISLHLSPLPPSLSLPPFSRAFRGSL